MRPVGCAGVCPERPLPALSPTFPGKVGKMFLARFNFSDAFKIRATNKRCSRLVLHDVCALAFAFPLSVSDWVFRRLPWVSLCT